MSTSILVTGATGNQGSGVADALLAAGFTVHALVRSPSSASALALQARGVKLFQGDLLDASSLTPALAGVTGVFLNTFMARPAPGSTVDPQVLQAQNLIAASHTAGTVSSIVASSAISTAHNWPVSSPLAGYYASKTAIEDAVKAAGFRYTTILRPGWMMYNYHGAGPGRNWPELATKHELTVSYAPETKLGHLAEQDVGKFAAAAFLEPEKFAGKEIELVGENLTAEGVATALSKAAGVEIKARFREDEETEGVEGKIGGLGFQLAMRDEPGVFEVDLKDVEKWGIKLTTLEEYFADEKKLAKLKEMLGV